MATALVRVSAGTATVYSSGSLSSLVGLGAISSIVVTRTDQTPPNDPVKVDLSSVLGQLRGDCTITVQGGATAYVGGGLVNVGVVNGLTLNGGRLVIQSTLLSASLGSTITVGPNAGELRIEPQGFGVSVDFPVKFVDAQGNPTTRIPPNFVMDFPNTQSVGAVYKPSTNQTVIGDGVSALGLINVGRTTTLEGDPFNLRVNGKPQTDFLGGLTGYGYTFSRNNGHDDGRNGVITCYLAGSLIRTETGDVPVEVLTVGDAVAVFAPDGQPQGFRRVKWVGQGRVTVQPALPDDEAGWPVRIRRGALGANIPHKDMLVTSEHCLLLEGHFVPVRMLVNGSSIVYDRSLEEYEYWHFAVEPHAIVEADGALTESYLDTGNRQGFVSQAGQWAEGARGCWETDAAAPLGVSRTFVEPLHEAIRRRSGGRMEKPGELVDEPDLIVLTPSGQTLPLVRQAGQRYLFRLSEGCNEILLVSRVSRPCDVIGPFVDDRRWLGVLVSQIQLFWEDGERKNVTEFLSAPRQDGWDVQEAAPCRWTNGAARLVLPVHPGRKQPLFVSVEVLAGGPYLAKARPTEGIRLGGGMF
ncbi:hypothetical protein GM609_08720 [Bombella sp. ESL0387]|nr:hypothetical protein [Bombella sp. ESL0387]